MFELLQDIWKPFSPKTEEEWKRLIQELGKATSGLGISPAERAQIVAAMGLPSGHWYTCPNGHVYAIGNCGGAVHVSIYKYTYLLSLESIMSNSMHFFNEYLDEQMPRV